MPDNIDQPQTSSGESLKGNSLDVKIGYDKRAAAKRDLAVVLQDVEGSQLTDAAGNELISEIEGFVTSELTSEKAVSVVAPTETRTVSNFYTIVFGNEFIVNKADANREDHYNNQGNPAPLSAPNQLLWKKTAHVKIKNPDPTWKQIFKGARIQIASGLPVTEDISAFPEVTGPNYPTGLPERLNAPDGHSFETFTVDAVYEIPPQAGKTIDPVTGYDYSRDNESGTFEIQFNINADPKVDSSTRLFTFLRRLIVKERSGTMEDRRSICIFI